MYMSMDMMGIPFELYINGETIVISMAGEAYSGTLQDLEALGMSQYGSLEGALNSTGSASFNQYKDAIESIDKKEVNGETVYTLVLDVTKMDSEQMTGSLAQSGAMGDVTTMTVTYNVGADGLLKSSTMEMGATGFSMVTTATMSDVDKTVVPDAPQATHSLSELSGLMGSSSSAAEAA